jgi:hypothetical protein
MDFSLASLVCEPGAYIIFDDIWMPSIQRVVAFIRGNRHDFEVVPAPEARIAIFRKIDKDKRKWDHFVSF